MAPNPTQRFLSSLGLRQKVDPKAQKYTPLTNEERQWLGLLNVILEETPPTKEEGEKLESLYYLEKLSGFINYVKTDIPFQIKSDFLYENKETLLEASYVTAADKKLLKHDTALKWSCQYAQLCILSPIFISGFNKLMHTEAFGGCITGKELYALQLFSSETEKGLHRQLELIQKAHIEVPFIDHVLKLCKELDALKESHLNKSYAGTPSGALLFVDGDAYEAYAPQSHKKPDSFLNKLLIKWEGPPVLAVTVFFRDQANKSRAYPAWGRRKGLSYADHWYFRSFDLKVENLVHSDAKEALIKKLGAQKWKKQLRQWRGAISDALCQRADLEFAIDIVLESVKQLEKKLRVDLRLPPEKKVFTSLLKEEKGLRLLSPKKVLQFLELHNLLAPVEVSYYIRRLMGIQERAQGILFNPVFRIKKALQAFLRVLWSGKQD